MCVNRRLVRRWPVRQPVRNGVRMSLSPSASLDRAPVHDDGKRPKARHGGTFFASGLEYIYPKVPVENRSHEAR